MKLRFSWWHIPLFAAVFTVVAALIWWEPFNTWAWDNNPGLTVVLMVIAILLAGATLLKPETKVEGIEVVYVEEEKEPELSKYAVELLHTMGQDKNKWACIVDSRGKKWVQCHGRTFGEGDIAEGIRYCTALEEEICGLGLARWETGVCYMLTPAGLDWLEENK